MKESKLLLTIFTFLISFTSFAKIEKFDINKDGIIDRIDTYDNDLLIKRQEDRNGDKAIDVEITYTASNRIFKIEKFDSNYDGNFDRIKTFERFKSKFTKVTYKIDKNFDKKFDRTYIETYLRDQKDRVSCIQDLKDEVDSFVRDGISAVASTNKGFIPTNFGYSIDQACVKKWGPNFPSLLKSTIQKGLQCMTRIHSQFSGPNTLSGALRNSKGLIDLANETPVSIVCSEETGYDWDGTAGHASTEIKDIIETPPVKHPFISINPFHPVDKPVTKDVLQTLKGTILHENLHNLGYLHGDKIEFPQACDSCCFPPDDDNENAKNKKEIGCKICNGDYPSEDSLSYLKDYVDFSDLSYDFEVAYLTLKKSLKENPNDIERLILFARTQKGFYNPIGKALADIIQSERELTSTQKKGLDNAREFSPEKGKKSAKVIAQVMYDIYANQDAKLAIQNLIQNKHLIKSEMDRLNRSSDITENAIGESIRDSLDGLVIEVWLNEYGNGAKDLSVECHELDIFFELSN